MSRRTYEGVVEVIIDRALHARPQCATRASIAGFLDGPDPTVFWPHQTAARVFFLKKIIDHSVGNCSDHFIFTHGLLHRRVFQWDFQKAMPQFR